MLSQDKLCYHPLSNCIKPMLPPGRRQQYNWRLHRHPLEDDAGCGHKQRDLLVHCIGRCESHLRHLNLLCGVLLGRQWPWQVRQFTLLSKYVHELLRSKHLLSLFLAQAGPGLHLQRWRLWRDSSCVWGLHLGSDQCRQLSYLRHHPCWGCLLLRWKSVGPGARCVVCAVCSGGGGIGGWGVKGVECGPGGGVLCTTPGAAAVPLSHCHPLLTCPLPPTSFPAAPPDAAGQWRLLWRFVFHPLGCVGWPQVVADQRRRFSHLRHHPGRNRLLLGPRH